MTTTAEVPAGPDRLLRYGSYDDQYVEVSAPSGRARARARGTLVLIHGGYWRAPFTAALMHPLVPEFTARGWRVANVEYRRGHDGWAATHDDLGAALAAIRADAAASATVGADGGAVSAVEADGAAPPASDADGAASADSRLAIVGHSVGGQLALLGAGVRDAVVALAPVTDLVRGYHEGIGDGAVAEFLHGGPDDLPETYASASPLLRLPPRGEVLIVHGRDDARVPVAHSRDYLAAALAAGAVASLLELPRLPHLDAIAPDAPHWEQVHAWLDRWIATESS